VATPGKLLLGHFKYTVREDSSTGAAAAVTVERAGWARLIRWLPQACARAEQVVNDGQGAPHPNAKVTVTRLSGAVPAGRQGGPV